MAGGALSIAQTLRVIGQDLETLGVRAFELSKLSEEYVVQVDRNGSGDRVQGKNLFQRINEKFHGAGSEISNPLHFATEQIIWSDIERAVHRDDSSRVPDSGKLSLVLRVLGNFLDEKNAGDFTISWSSDGAQVNYNRKVENFTIDNLYDLGVRMYLKRSGRVSER
jgi:hypothetical protein